MWLGFFWCLRFRDNARSYEPYVHLQAPLGRRRDDYCRPTGVRNRSARRAIDRHDAPAVTHVRAIDMIDAGHRAVLDCKREGCFGVEAER